MAVDSNTYYCEKCNRTMSGDQFYGSNDLEKYPNNGKLKQCKKCITMHVDNWNPDTYIPILQEVDVPYIPEEWSKLLQTYCKDPSKVTGMTVLGRYLSKMKLKQWQEFRYKDSEHLQAVANNKKELAMKKQGFDAVQIADAIEKSSVIEKPEGYAAAQPQEDYFSDISGGGDDFQDDLTDEDRTYLRLKWGKTYRPEEWIKLEQLFNEMMDSYDIQYAGHIDTLKLICKTSLKANQLIDLGDVEGFQKMSRVYDSLMKSGNFTAAQNKAASGEFVDSISELVTVCEKEGFIPRYYTDAPKDRVDETLQDMKNYCTSLITGEMNLGNLIEQAVQTMNREENKEEDIDIEDDLTLDGIDALKDEDFVEHGDFLEEELDEDEEFMNTLLKDDEV